jgi:hypothetical protein
LQILKDFFLSFQRKHREALLEREAEQKHNASMTYYFKPSSVSKYHPNEQKQTLTTDALVMFIAGDILPLSIVDSPNFRQFVEKLDPK